MRHNNPGIIGQVPLLYRLRFKLQVYLANRRVKSYFGGKTSPGPYMLLIGVIGTLVLLISIWFLSKDSPVQDQSQNNKTVISMESIEPIIEEKKSAPPPQPVTELVEQNFPAPTVSPPNVEEKEDKEKTTVEAIPAIVETAAAVAKETPHYMRTRADFVNVRENFFLESEIIARLNVGYVVRIIDHQGDWIYADTGGNTHGWIYTNLLESVTQREFESWRENPKRFSAKKILRHDFEDPEIFNVEKEKIKKELEQWRYAWQTKNIDIYISFYSKIFATPKHNWESYKQYKEYIFKKPGLISIEISDINIKWGNYMLIASFIQKYQSDSINSTRKKIIYFQQEKDTWKITMESVIRP